MAERFEISVDEQIWSQLQALRSVPPHGKWAKFPGFARTLADYQLRLLPEGRNSWLLGNYVLIALYQYWEDSGRGQIAAAVGVDKNLIKSDYWAI